MKFTSIFAAIVLAVMTAAPAYAGGYMTVPDIAGESQRRGHEKKIEIDNVSYAIDGPERSAAGSARMRARAQAGDFIVTKSVDAASPYIALAAFQQRSFDEIVIEMTRPGASGADRKYLTITLTNVRISSVATDVSDSGESAELVGLAYEKIKILYTAGNGDEHEVEYDVARGV